MEIECLVNFTYKLKKLSSPCFSVPSVPPWLFFQHKAREVL